MNVKTIRCLWDASNVIRTKVHYVWCIDEITRKNFKQWCNTKEGKEEIKKASFGYMKFSLKEKELDNEAEFLDAYVSNDMIYIDVKTDETNIADVLSFGGGSNLWFESVTFNHLKSM